MKVFHYKWEWTLQSSPETLWPFLSDTNRLNRDAGLPAVEPAGYAETSGPAPKKILRFHTAGMTVEWEEKPFEWIEPFELGVERLYYKGPLALLKTKTELRPSPQGGTHLVYESWITPKNFLGQILIPLQVGQIMRRKLGRLIHHYDHRASRHSKSKIPDQDKLEINLTETEAKSQAEVKIKEWISSADDLHLARIRPYVLADQWKLPRRQTLEAFLTLTQKGLLEFQWEMICPHCRGSEQKKSSLEDISSSASCKNCGINYKTNFDQLVELTFRPHPKRKVLEKTFFCTGGPKTTPHISAQFSISENEEKEIPLESLKSGRYRARALKNPKELYIDHDPKTAKSLTLSIAESGVTAEISAGSRTLKVHNQTHAPQFFILEKMAWADDAVSAKDVTSLGLFRELFSLQRLRNGEQISIGTMTFVFTDLRASTKLYQEIGDPAAFGTVVSHFDIVREAIQRHGGTVIKTIGDAVMAVFMTPLPALQAIREAQSKLRAPAERPLYLKAGIHQGTCLAVTSNNLLDYFGSSVNIAARLVSLSSGEDIILSETAANDAEVKSFLKNSEGIQAKSFQTTIKGFGAEVFELTKV